MCSGLIQNEVDKNWMKVEFLLKSLCCCKRTESFHVGMDQAWKERKGRHMELLMYEIASELLVVYYEMYATMLSLEKRTPIDVFARQQEWLSEKEQMRRVNLITPQYDTQKYMFKFNP